jgi:hypothetical protein
MDVQTPAYIWCSLIFFFLITLLITPLWFFLLVQAGDALIELYNHFISDFETKINLLKFAHFTIVISCQYLDNDFDINYLEGVISKLQDTRESQVKEPILYVRMQIATFLLEKGNQNECKKRARPLWMAWLMLILQYKHPISGYVPNTIKPAKTTLNSTRVLFFILHISKFLTMSIRSLSLDLPFI